MEPTVFTELPIAPDTDTVVYPTWLLKIAFGMLGIVMALALITTVVSALVTALGPILPIALFGLPVLLIIRKATHR